MRNVGFSTVGIHEAYRYPRARGLKQNRDGLEAFVLAAAAGEALDVWRGAWAA